MNLLAQTKKICETYGIKPARSKGQNFLIKEEVYDKIVEAAEIKDTDTVLEVGPGLGFLTVKLAKSAGKLITVELDDKLATYVRTGIESGGFENVEVVNMNILDFNPLNPPYQGDIVKGPLDKGGMGGYKIVANLPYNITSVFLRKFLGEAEVRPELMVLMLQKEVAKRICAKPGDMSILAVSIQYYADAEIIDYVPKYDFFPRPEVDSAIIKIKSKKTRKQENKNFNERDFFRLVKIGFSAKRKMLKNNLSAGFRIPQNEAEEKIVKAGFNPKCRAEDLGVEDWMKLFPYFYN